MGKEEEKKRRREDEKEEKKKKKRKRKMNEYSRQSPDDNLQIAHCVASVLLGARKSLSSPPQGIVVVIQRASFPSTRRALVSISKMLKDHDKRPNLGDTAGKTKRNRVGEEHGC
jgi:hypothetical protein